LNNKNKLKNMEKILVILTSKEMKEMSCTELTEYKINIERFLERISTLTRKKALNRIKN
jgi:hypothetical protein